MPMDFCCYPKCEKPPSALADVPLCDRHCQKVYLTVLELVAQTSPEDQVAASGYRGKAAPTPAYTDGTVYFIRKGNLIKIGWTGNMPKRMRELKPDQILATMPGTFQDEKNMHVRFRDLREQGEWFRIGPDLVALIGSLWVSQDAA